MIEITKINDKRVFINSDLIEMLEATPDTTITLTTGRKIIARESVDDIVARALAYKREALGLPPKGA